jgi:hypothetical protein
MENPAFQNERYTEREAWEWLISSAVWQHEGRTISINRKPIKIERGQLAYSLRFMAEAWKWDKAKVSRFLEHLKKWDMIETLTETGITVISICKYNDYQIGETQSETVNDEKPRQDRDRGETNSNNLNNFKKRKTNNTPPKGVSKPDDVAETVWGDFIAHRKIKKAKVTETAIQGIRREAEKAGWEMNDALAEICQRGWTGFKSDWVNKEKSNEKNFGNSTNSGQLTKTERAKRTLMQSAIDLGYADAGSGGQESLNELGLSVLPEP